MRQASRPPCASRQRSTSSRFDVRYGSISASTHALEMRFLIGREFRGRQAGDLRTLAKLNFAFLRRLRDQRFFAMLAVEHLIERVGLERLVPEDIVRMVGLLVEAVRRVAVEDRAAERDVLGRVAVATDRQVPARHHEFELSALRRAEKRDRLGLAVTAGVVGKLLADAVLPVGIVEAEIQGLDQLLLVLGEEVRWRLSRA